MTAGGILIAILLVWAQLLTTMAQEYRNHGQCTLTAGYELSYVYYSILTALIAFIILLIRQKIDRISQCFLYYSLVVAVLLISASVYPVTSKVLSNEDVLNPLDISKLKWISGILMNRLFVEVWFPIIIFVVICIIIFLHKNICKFFKNRYECLKKRLIKINRRENRR